MSLKKAKDGRLPPSVENELVSVVMERLEVGCMR